MFITTSTEDHEKRIENNLFVRSGKSEAEVTNNRRLRSTYCTIEAFSIDRREVSRGLSATAELLVSYGSMTGGVRSTFPRSTVVYSS